MSKTQIFKNKTTTSTKLNIETINRQRWKTNTQAKAKFQKKNQEIQNNLDTNYVMNKRLKKNMIPNYKPNLSMYE